MADYTDGCLERTGQVKTASATIYLVEEVGDARLRCDQLIRYLDEAVQLIEKSDKKDHFFEVAGHLIKGIPETAFKLQKALQAVALATDRIDYEELKQELRPEKVEELERVLQDVRIRPVPHRSETPMNPKQAAKALRELVRIANTEGSLPVYEVAEFLTTLDPPGVVAAIERKAADKLEKLAEMLEDPNQEPLSRVRLAAVIRRVAMEAVIDDAIRQASTPRLTQDHMQLADAQEVKDKFKESNPDISEESLNEIAEQWKKNKDVVKDKAAGFDDFPSVPALFESIKDKAIVAVRAANSKRWRQALLDLSFIVDDIGTILVQMGAMDVSKSEALKREIRKVIPHAAESLEQSAPMMMAASEGPAWGVEATEEKRTKFEKDKPADPTESMSPSDAAKWKTQTEENKDNFKAATDGEDAARRSRFEQGVSADPTQNMDPEDAKNWKEEHDKNKDNFKEASGDAVAAGKLTTHLEGKSGHTMCGEQSDPKTLVKSVKDASCYYCKQAWEKKHSKAAVDWKA